MRGRAAALFGSGAAGGAEMGVLRCSQGRVALASLPSQLQLSYALPARSWPLLSESSAEPGSGKFTSGAGGEGLGGMRAPGLPLPRSCCCRPSQSMLQESRTLRYGQAGSGPADQGPGHSRFM